MVAVGVAMTADKLKIDVLYDNVAKPANMGVAGILAVRNGQQLTYKQADITVTNNTAGSTAYGIQNAAAITGGDTTITMKGGGNNQTLVGIDTDTMDTNTKTELSGNTQVNINAGGDNSTLDGIFLESKVAQYSQQSGNINIALNSTGYTNNTVNGL